MAVKTNASTLEAALQNGLSGWMGNFSSQGRFPQVAGLRYSFDPARPQDSRLVAAELAAPDGSWTPLAEFSGPILLLSTDYLTKGGDFFEMLATQPVLLDSSKPIAELVATYIAAKSPVAPQTDGRIVNCAQSPGVPLCGGSGSGTPAPAPAAAPAARRSRRLHLRG